MFGGMFSSSSPVSPPTCGGFTGQLGAMDYGKKEYSGSIQLTSPAAIGNVIGAQEWNQGQDVFIKWDVEGNFPFVEIR